MYVQSELKIINYMNSLCLTDIDECHLGQHNCKVGRCSNTVGSYTCVSEPKVTCPAGYKPSSDEGKQCQGKLNILASLCIVHVYLIAKSQQ